MSMRNIATVVGTVAAVSVGFAGDYTLRSVPPLRQQNISSPAAPGSSEPNLSAGADGRVYMTWLEPVDSAFALRTATLRGTTWSTPVTIRAGRDFFVNWADFPSIQVGERGQLAVHWLQRNGTGTYAYGVRVAQSKDDGRTWSAAITPHRDSVQAEHGFVALWREKAQLGVVWLDGRKFSSDSHAASNEMMLVTTTVGPTGALGAEVRLDERTCDCCQNSAAVTTKGPIIAYRNRSDQEIRDIYVTRRIDGKWIPGVQVYNDNWHIAACPVNGPAVVAAGDRVALAWFTAANDSPRVKLAFSDDAGARFSAPVRVDGGSPAGRVGVVWLNDGTSLISWVERTGGEAAEVRARRVARDGTMGPAVTIASSSAARASGFPRMVASGSDVVFAWTVAGRPSQVRIARVPQASFK